MIGTHPFDVWQWLGQAPKNATDKMTMNVNSLFPCHPSMVKIIHSVFVDPRYARVAVFLRWVTLPSLR